MINLIIINIRMCYEIADWLTLVCILYDKRQIQLQGAVIQLYYKLQL